MDNLDTSEIFIKMARDIGINPNLSQREITLLMQQVELTCELEYGSSVANYLFRTPVEVDEFGNIMKERIVN